MKKLRYTSPKISTKQLRINFFSSQHQPFLDGLDHLLAPNAFAASCFIKDTRILLTDNTTKPIQDIREGDIVFSYNTTTHQLEKEKVVETITHYSSPGGYLVINKKLKVTPNHPFWLPDKSAWPHAGELEVGDTLQAIDTHAKPHQIPITSIEKVPGVYDVYNLHLEGDNHDFFAEGVLVHNQCVPQDNGTLCKYCSQCPPNRICGCGGI